MKYGNQDAEQEHDLSELRIKPDHVVVRSYNVIKGSKGSELEDPDSSRLQVYEKEVFDRMSAQKKDKMSGQSVSDFERLGQAYQVLHLPE